MRQKLIYTLCILALVGTAQIVSGFNYLYFSDHEVTPLGEPVRFPASDTLFGTIRTNDCFQCSQSGHDYLGGLVMMSCTETNCTGDNVYTGVPRLPFPAYADPLRAAIPFRGGEHFEPEENALAFVRLRGSIMNIYWGIQGVPFDSTHTLCQTVELESNAIYFFECPIRISGELNGSRIVIASSGDIGIDDDICYTCLDFAHDHDIPDHCNDMLALVAEGSVVVMNTWANGRDNEAQGSSIVISALVVALGRSFTFDQQNDVWDTYIGPTPDERGTIHLRGALAQRYHGYVHRANNGGTGYRKDYDFDDRLLQWNIGLFADEPPLIDPPELDFGEVVVGETVWDTLTIRPVGAASYSGTTTSQPFYSPPVYHLPATEFRIPVSFTPPQVRDYSGYVYFYLGGTFHSVDVLGTGIHPPESQTLTASAHPNPFNAVTTLSLTLPQSGDLTITLFDLLGRQVEQFSYSNLPPGSQQLRLDMSRYTSGVYFAQLRSGRHTITHKLLLMK